MIKYSKNYRARMPRDDNFRKNNENQVCLQLYLNLLRHEHFGERKNETYKSWGFDNECSCETKGQTMTKEMKCGHLVTHGSHL